MNLFVVKFENNQEVVASETSSMRICLHFNVLGPADSFLVQGHTCGAFVLVSFTIMLHLNRVVVNCFLVVVVDNRKSRTQRGSSPHCNFNKFSGRNFQRSRPTPTSIQGNPIPGQTLRHLNSLSGNKTVERDLPEVHHIGVQLVRITWYILSQSLFGVWTLSTIIGGELIFVNKLEKLLVGFLLVRKHFDLARSSRV